MKTRTVVLVNPNRMRPPVAPLGLEYLATAVEAAGFAPLVVDLAFAEDPVEALADAFRSADPLAVGLTLRNLDDCYMASGAWFLPDASGWVKTIKGLTGAPVVLGGTGFSIAPRPALEATGADYGVRGDGEWPFIELLSALAAGGDVSGVPGLVFRRDGRVEANPAKPWDLAELPAQARDHLDNARYFAEGGQGAIETKRGCDGGCIYCVDCHTKGRVLRLRDPRRAADEVEALLAQGVDVLHTADAEFNRPYDHAAAVCRELARRGLPVRWYAYASPSPFDAQLAQAMAEAGCLGVDFGADSGDDDLLAGLGRDHRGADLAAAAAACKEAGMAVMFDLLVGGPGETRESLQRTVDLVCAVPVDVIGVNIGARVYPGTALADSILAEGRIAENPCLHGEVEDNEEMLRPVFYVSPALGDDPLGAVRVATAGDARFLLPVEQGAQKGYNYNDNSPLEAAIAAGARGAYWDIIRRMS